MFEEGNIILRKSQENTTVSVAKAEGTIVFLESKLEKLILRYRKESSSGLPQLPRHLRIKQEQKSLPEWVVDDGRHTPTMT